VASPTTTRGAVPWPADKPGPGSWCTDLRHGDVGTQVSTLRHGQGKRWVGTDGQERSKSFERKAQAQVR
jgi:hypothetical protein